MKNYIFVLLSIFTFSAHSAITGKVLSIHDGDTLQMEIKGKKERVRLLGVDTPEVDFQGETQGEAALKARDYLRSLLPLNATVEVRTQDKALDSNGRLLGQIIYQGRDLNLEMLQSGLAAVYFIYPFDKKVVSLYVAAAEAGALKADQSVLPGYVFRQKVKGYPGTNMVADFTRKCLSSDIEKVPAHRRVFFSDESIALSQGYRTECE